jgi:hypothetical protein
MKSGGTDHRFLWPVKVKKTTLAAKRAKFSPLVLFLGDLTY